MTLNKKRSNGDLNYPIVNNVFSIYSLIHLFIHPVFPPPFNGVYIYMTGSMLFKEPLIVPILPWAIVWDGTVTDFSNRLTMA